MEIFDWRPNPGEQVVSPYIWIYWAIVGPLTVFVAAFVMSFIAAKSSSSSQTSATLTKRLGRTRRDQEQSSKWGPLRDVLASRRNGDTHGIRNEGSLDKPAGLARRSVADVERGHAGRS